MAVGSHSDSDSMSYPLAAVKVLPEAKMLPDALTVKQERIPQRKQSEDNLILSSKV